MATIIERNGKFCVIYSYTDVTGKRKQKWETFIDKASATRRKKEIEYKNKTGHLVVPHCKILSELLSEYVSLYGKDKWSLSTYERNTALIKNYINPLIGKTRLTNINTRFLENYYQALLKTPALPSNAPKKDDSMIGTSTIRDIHKLLRSAFEQAVKWELMDKNPAIHATVPKHKAIKRDIWTAETLMEATDLCEDDKLKLAINLAFSASLRIGELCALTWDCVDISPEAIAEERCFVYINKEFQRVSKEAIDILDGKDILLIFPSEGDHCKTVRVLKTPKTESSIRKVYIPNTVVNMLQAQKDEQEDIKKHLGSEYKDYNLVFASTFGMPLGSDVIRKKFRKFIRENDLPDVVFHSLRHTSVTYKLKLNGGDIKSVQGDSGHAQVNMVTDVYSHILDEDRRKNAALFEEAFYGKKNLNPQMSETAKGKMITVPEGVDADALAKVLADPAAFNALITLASTIKSN